MARKFNATGRSTKTPFIMLRHDIFNSHAWQSLNAVGRCVWLHIVSRYNGINNGNIPLSCLEAGKFLGVSKNTANNAFKKLIEAGFIKVAIPSSFNMKMRRATRWTLTHERVNDKPPTNEWKARSKELSKSEHGHVSALSQSHNRDIEVNPDDYSPA